MSASVEDAARAAPETSHLLKEVADMAVRMPVPAPVRPGNPRSERLSRRRAGLAGLAVLAGAAVTALAACGSSASQGSSGGSPAPMAPVKIGVFEVASATILDQTVAAFEAELKARLAPRGVSFDLKNAEGNQSLITSIAGDFAQSGDDGFAVIGTPAVIALAQQEKSKPIFAIAMGDPVGAKVARSLVTPGGNVTGSIDYVDPAILLKSIMKIGPAPKKIGTIYDPSNENMQVWIKALGTAVKAYPGLSVVESAISGAQDVPAAARSLTGRVDAELIGPDATVISALPVVGSTALSAKIPAYVIGGDPTTAGILASIGPNYPTLGRLAADAAVRVLHGTPAAQVSFGRPSGIEFAVNKATMRSLRISLPASLLASAGAQ